MTRAYATKTLADAIRERDCARDRLRVATFGTKRWRDAAEDLDFWMGKVANMEAALAVLPLA